MKEPVSLLLTAVEIKDMGAICQREILRSRQIAINCEVRRVRGKDRTCSANVTRDRRCRIVDERTVVGNGFRQRVGSFRYLQRAAAVDENGASVKSTAVEDNVPALTMSAPFVPPEPNRVNELLLSVTVACASFTNSP